MEIVIVVSVTDILVIFIKRIAADSQKRRFNPRRRTSVAFFAAFLATFLFWSQSNVSAFVLLKYHQQIRYS